jgi:3-hydroxyisobutyrate dehydrogenase
MLARTPSVRWNAQARAGRVQGGNMPDSKPRIGFIGLGLMGSAMTRRLVECGFPVTGFDIVSDKMTDASAHGVLPAASADEAVRDADIVVISVTGMPALEAALFAGDGILSAVRAGQVIVDTSTSDGRTSRDYAVRIKAAHDVDWVDAPVSGGPPAALAGTLAIMVGGEDGPVETAAPVLAALGRATHMGGIGAGQATKMVNQVLVLTNYCVLAEALKLAENAGVDAARIPDALADGHAGSNMLKNMFPKMVAREYDPPAGFAAQILKDLDMVHDAARATDTPTPMSDTARSLYRLLCSRGHGKEDGIALLKLYDDGPV